MPAINGSSREELRLDDKSVLTSGPDLLFDHEHHRERVSPAESSDM